MALCTLAQVKENLMIATAVTTYDALITRLINAATATIENYINRTVEDATYTEYMDGDGSKTYHTKQYPINSITSISYRTGDYNDDTWEAVDSDLYTYDSYSGMIYSQWGFSKGINNWKIIYNGGYATIPYDIEDACIRLVTFSYNNLNTQNVKKEQLGDRSIEYFQAATASTIRELGLNDILDQYREPLV